MFTGIIEEIGIVEHFGHGEITIAAKLIMSDLGLGQSVAIDGVDLTVASMKRRTFSAKIMNETYRRSTLGRLQEGCRVNLERSVRPTTRLSGHIVRGVVEGIATVTDVSADGNALVVRFSTDSELLSRVVVKGPVALDGASFTVIDLDPTSFAVSIVAYSMAHTTIADRGIGSLVNVETDIVARYVDTAVARLLSDRGTP